MGRVKILEQYLNTTTLHGFKYLNEANISDRIAWLVSVCAGVCSSGVLCAVLWSRFIQVPTLLYLYSSDAIEVMPPIGLCLPAEVSAEAFVSNMNYSFTLPLQPVLMKILQGKKLPLYQLSYLEHVLIVNNLTLAEAFVITGPDCNNIITRCRVDHQVIPCETIVHKDVTMFGACCVVRSSRRFKQQSDLFEKSKYLDIVINCTAKNSNVGLYYMKQHETRGWVESAPVWPGYAYKADISFQAIMGTGDESILDDSCVSDEDYSMALCRARCIERLCGCADPLIDYDDEEYDTLGVCSLVSLNCLRTQKHMIETCNCLPPCQKLTTSISFRQDELITGDHIYDPFYRNLDIEKNILMNVHVKGGGSRVFVRRPTETWVSLLSSLGGVFNMFLGVSVFSAVEFVYFVLRWLLNWSHSDITRRVGIA